MSPCPLCLSGALVKMPVPQAALYRRCTDCGYVQMDPSCRLTEAAERARYERHENSLSDDGYVAWLNRFLDFALTGREGLRILDFGSGPEPVMASLMAARGHEVLMEDKFFTRTRAGGRFDLITAVEVFEHLADPLQDLISLRERLNPGGGICISTELLPGEPEEFAGWHYRSDPTHIGFFSERALGRMAANAGMVLTRCDGRRYASFGLNASLIR